MENKLNFRFRKSIDKYTYECVWCVLDDVDVYYIEFVIKIQLPPNLDKKKLLQAYN